MSYEMQRRNDHLLPAAIEQSFDMTPEERAFADQVGKTMGSMKEMLAYDGVPRTVRGEELIVGQAHVELKDSEGNKYYARAFEANRDEIDGSTTTEWGVLYDQTESHEDIVASPTLLRIRQQVGFNPEIVLLPATDSGAGSRLNDPDVAAHVFELCPELEKAAKRAKDQREREERIEQMSKRQTREDRQRSAIKAAGVVAAAGVIGFGIYGIGQIDFSGLTKSDAEKFDDNGYELGPGRAIFVGETASPSFSEELYDQDELAYNKVPTIAGIHGSFNDLERLETDQITTDGPTSLRQILITSSEDGKNCETHEFSKRLPLDAKVVLWSDFTDIVGTPRVDELEVSVTTDAIEACWNGEERNDEDDPRVIVEVRD